MVTICRLLCLLNLTLDNRAHSQQNVSVLLIQKRIKSTLLGVRSF